MYYCAAVSVGVNRLLILRPLYPNNVWIRCLHRRGPLLHARVPKLRERRILFCECINQKFGLRLVLDNRGVLLDGCSLICAAVIVDGAVIGPLLLRLRNQQIGVVHLVAAWLVVVQASVLCMVSCLLCRGGLQGVFLNACTDSMMKLCTAIVDPQLVFYPILSFDWPSLVQHIANLFLLVRAQAVRTILRMRVGSLFKVLRLRGVGLVDVHRSQATLECLIHWLLWTTLLRQVATDVSSRLRTLLPLGHLLLYDVRHLARLDHGTA